MIKTFACCYSRTGTTLTACEAIAGTLNTEACQIREAKSRSGIFGFLSSGFDTVFKRKVALSHCPDPENANLLIIGAPVWACTIPPAVSQWIRSIDMRDKKAIAFTTHQGNPGKSLEVMTGLLENHGAHVIASFSLCARGLSPAALHAVAVEHIISLNDMISQLK